MKTVDQAIFDVTFRLRPGALAGNTALLLDLVKAVAREAGETKLVLPVDAVRGGSCGSLDTHPAFMKAVAAAERKFAAAVTRVRHAPRISYDRSWRVDHPGEIVGTAGPDPRLPFCGSAETVFFAQVAGLARRLAAIGCADAVIGLSGGLDSALALLVTLGAFDLLGLDRRGIHVYTLPGFGTTARTRGNARRLAEGLGLSIEAIGIANACRQHFKDIRQPEGLHDVTFENAQARERTQILMDKANQVNGIVVGTGDLSEIALGWCTYNGDHMSMFGVNAGVPKTAIREICRRWAETELVKPLAPDGANAGFRQAAEALLDIVETPVSPELLPADGDAIAQKTEDHVGPYELHDFFLWHFIAEQEGRAAIIKAAKAAFKGVYDAAAVAKWLDVFFRRFFAQAFKRNCAPDGVQAYKVFLSPAGWHVPSDISGAAFR